MQLGPVTDEGVVYQVTDNIDGMDVVIDIAYSSTEEGVLEFEWAHAEEDSNPGLTVDQLNMINKVLENGYEESVVIALVEHYKNIGAKFDIGEWKHVPYSVLYDATAE